MFRVLPHRLLTEPRAKVVATAIDHGEATARLRIEGLVCSACAANVGGRLRGLPGVREADVDLDRGEAFVRYERGRATAEALVAAVEGAVVLRPLRRLIARLAGTHGRSGRRLPAWPAGPKP